MNTLVLATKNSVSYAALGITILLSSHTSPIIASGFALMEQSGTGLGVAYANIATGGEDISGMFYNPASLTRSSGTEFISTYYLILSDTQVNLDRTSDILNNPISGSNSINTHQLEHIPNFYFATNLSENLRLGVGITVPFGHSLDYGHSWAGRYELVNSRLSTLDINPSLAYRVNDEISVGFGFSAQYMRLEITQTLDFGSICIAQLGLGLCNVLSLLPQTADGNSHVDLEGWSWGYNFGLIFHPNDRFQFGIAYRSEINHHLDGSGQIDLPAQAAPLNATGVFNDSLAHATDTLPAHLSLGLSYQVSDLLKTLLSLTWTEWSVLETLLVDFEDPVQPSTQIDLNFQNTVRVSLGFDFQLTHQWSIQSGFSYDQSPVKNADNRTFYVPDSDRYWLSLGLNYQALDNINLNLSYAHVFFDKARINRRTTRGHLLEGSLETHVDIIGAQMRLIF